MPRIAIFTIACLLTLFAAKQSGAQEGLPGPAATAPAGGETLTTFEQQLGYSIGVNIGRELKQEGLPIDPAGVAAGIADAFSGGNLRLTDAQRQEVFQKLQQVMQARQQQRATQNSKSGEAFLAANAKKEGVKTTPSGLQYRVIKSGPAGGKSPAATDTVKCHYEGRLIDGTVFDSSYKRGEPTSFPLNRVIPGWTEAVQLMKPGDSWELYIPGKLAYGPGGSPPQIGPNATLIFKIELIEVAQR